MIRMACLLWLACGPQSPNPAASIEPTRLEKTEKPRQQGRPHGDEEGKVVDLCGRARAYPPGGLMPASPRESNAETDVTHYLLDIEIIPEYSGSTPIAVRVEATCTVDVVARVDGLNTFTLDLSSALLVNAVTGNVSGWSHAANEIIINLDGTYDEDEAFQVSVDYVGYPASAGYGAFQWWQRNSQVVVGTLSEPYYARYWWPCKDALDDKSTMEMHCTVPEPLIVGSNGVLEGVDTLSGSRRQYRWHESEQMAAYLAVLSITDYRQYDLTYAYDDGGAGGSMPVACYLYSDHWDTVNNQPFAAYKAGCDELISMLQQFATAYGEYPFVSEKYGIAETGGTGGLGANMEHQTLTSMYRVDNYTDIMAHEMAHHWWGDNVTCGTWYDIWLNEGFATYSESLYRELQSGESAYWTRMNVRRPTVPDNRVYRTSIGSVAAIFSLNDVYQKGCWVVHMLRHVMGDAQFFSALSDYRATYSRNFATTAQFAASMSGSFGHDLTWFTDQWVMAPGSPDYEWNYETAFINGGRYLKLAVWQTQAEPPFTMPIDIRVTTSSSVWVHTIWNDEAAEHYVLPFDGLLLGVEFDSSDGISDRNWILFGSRAKVLTPVEPLPVILSADITIYSADPLETTAAIEFSEDISGFDGADLTLVGASTGAHAPSSVTWSGATLTATATFDQLPNDDYTLTILADDIDVLGRQLDGEIDDSAWWDNTLFPSGDGQPGGDGVVSFTLPAGDANCDGVVDNNDIDAFIAVLLELDTAPCHILRSNMDNGPTVDGDDLQAFLDALLAVQP